MTEPTAWSEELRASHLAVSREDLEFREAAKDDPRFLDSKTFEPLLAEIFEYKLQCWPTFLGAAKRAELEAASLGVCEVLRKVPERVFGNDAAAIARFYKLASPELAELYLAEPNGIAAGVARGDYIDSVDGFKCLEVNYSPRIGGWEAAPLVAAHMRIPPTAEFVETAGIRVAYSNTIRLFFAHIIRESLAAGLAADGVLNVVTIREVGHVTGTPSFKAHLRQELAAALAEAGGLEGEFAECYPDELVTMEGSLYLGERRIDAAIEFTEFSRRHVYRAYKANKLMLFNGPIDSILSDKRNLALLSEGLDKGGFTREEKESIRRYVPWTRLVLPGRADFYGEEMAMRDLLLTHREELVLKESQSFGGKGVVIGAFTPEARWREVVESSLARGDSIVQERVESLPYLYQYGEYGAQPNDMIWGPFLFGRTYGGLFLRMQPQAARNVVNLTQAASEGTPFEV